MNQVTSFSFDQLSSTRAEQQTDNFAERARAARLQPKTEKRIYEIEWLAKDGTPRMKSCAAPTSARCEKAFNAFARGSLIDTPNGPVAIEDLLPGDKICTSKGKSLPLVWKGCMTISQQSDATNRTLYRVTNGSFGNVDAMPDPLLGAGARLMRGAPETGGSLQDIGTLCDGFSVIPVMPRSAVRVYHLALESHSIIRVNGLPMETFHPGHSTGNQGQQGGAGLADLFPHLKSLTDFGPLCHQRADSIS